jgi:apolipoprotein D and lipocalin family protein
MAIAHKRKMVYFLIILFAFLVLGTYMLYAKTRVYDLQTVAKVDLEKYLGKWYDIASFPQRFQKGCHNTSAVYTLSPKGHIVVENSCNKDSLTGKLSYIKGKAFVVKNSQNTKLKVQFFWPFKGDYWIIDLADDYSYAVVSEPRKKYLWILCRTPQMDAAVYKEILNRLDNKGFEIDKLQQVVHETAFQP